MIEIVLQAENDLDEWRRTARQALETQLPPEQVDWRPPSAPSAGLFAEPFTAGSDKMGREVTKTPKRFLQLASSVLCHRDPDRFNRLYRMLWRLQDNPQLLSRSTDPDMHWLARAEKSVHRDMHKMKAFVRFREIPPVTARENYIAWFEPDHRIVEATAPFFMRRFTSMDWTILTPERSARWNGTQLTFGEGARRDDAPQHDAVEAEWKTYFASIFNPARVKLKAMTAEMPKKYWKNMPETELIPDLVAHARRRAQKMTEHAVTLPHIRTEKVKPHFAASGARESISDSHEDPTAGLTGCRRCLLYGSATQAVPGTGPLTAEMMIVGEQPGDQEDLSGIPFVGPAGQMLDKAMAEAGVDRSDAYLTNAVKHFKFRPQGKRRLHQRPNAGEVEHCRWWLQKEIDLVRPKIILGLGATAARSLLGRPGRIADLRGQEFPSASGAIIQITVHPSYLLRLPNKHTRDTEYRKFVREIAAAKKQLQRLSRDPSARAS